MRQGIIAGVAGLTLEQVLPGAAGGIVAERGGAGEGLVGIPGVTIPVEVALAGHRGLDEAPEALCVRGAVVGVRGGLCEGQGIGMVFGGGGYPGGVAPVVVGVLGGDRRQPGALLGGGDVVLRLGCRQVVGSLDGLGQVGLQGAEVGRGLGDVPACVIPLQLPGVRRPA